MHGEVFTDAEAAPNASAAPVTRKVIRLRVKLRWDK
jgi:hypothetical protein